MLRKSAISLTVFTLIQNKTKQIVVLLVLFYTLSALSLAQDSLAPLIARIKPSVVKVFVYDEEKKPTATGSGFFISDTQVMTNKHVVGGSTRIQIKTFDGSIIVITKIQVIQDVDIAILTFQSGKPNIKPLLSAANAPREGDRIFVYGSPLGLEGSVSDGIVSATRTIRGGTYMQITAPISKGSSGSPVVDMEGRVVGIATLTRLDGQNMNFAVPVGQVISFWFDQKDNNSSIADNYVKPKNSPLSESDLTGQWRSSVNSLYYQVVDSGSKVSINWILDGKYVSREFSDIDAKWVGNLIIGYKNADLDYTRYFFVIKKIDADTVAVWRVGTLRPTDSNEKILRVLTKKSNKKPKEIWKRTY